MSETTDGLDEHPDLCICDSGKRPDPECRDHATEGVELAVPDKAVTALEGHYDDVHRDLADLSGMMRETDDYIRAIATPVVAAELRRLAQGHEDEGMEFSRTGFDAPAEAQFERAHELHARADELEGKQ